MAKVYDINGVELQTIIVDGDFGTQYNRVDVDNDTSVAGNGTSALYGLLTATELAVVPHLTDIDVVDFQTQTGAVSTGDNQLEGILSVNVNVDAQNMTETTEFWSTDSRADLVIEDVRNDSADTKIGMRSTDNGTVDYSVYFSPDHITKDEVKVDSNSAYVYVSDLNLVDALLSPSGRKAVTATDVVFNLQIPYVALNLNVNNILTPVNLNPALNAIPLAVGLTTYNSLITQMNISFDSVQMGGDGTLGSGLYVASLSTLTERVDHKNGASYVLPVVEITSAPGQAAASFNGGLSQWALGAQVAGDTNYASGTESDIPYENNPLTRVDVELDHVGRDSRGGDLKIGNMSVGSDDTKINDSGSQGIQQFNVQVDRVSWLQEMSSTDNTLEVVNLENIDMMGAVRIDTLEDVRVVNASTMEGAVTIGVQLTKNVVAKYMNLTDDNLSLNGHESDDINFNYKTGSGDDSVIVKIDSANLAQAGTLAREDLTLDIDTSEGNDKISVYVVQDATTFRELLAVQNDARIAHPGTSSSNWYENHQINSDIVINSGGGNDTVKTPGAGDFFINTQAGEDVIFTDNMGGQFINDVLIGGKTNLGNAVFVFNALPDAAGLVNINDIESNPLASFAGVNMGLVVSFQGLESVRVEIAGSGSAATDVAITSLEVNQAIKNAINNDAQLKNLIVAEDGPANTLVLRSLIDGELRESDLSITASQSTAVAGATDSSGAINAAYNTVIAIQETAAGTAYRLTGEHSWFETNNIINAGAGNDVIVLSASDNLPLASTNVSNEVIVLENQFSDNQTNLETGDTVVNFVQGSSTTRSTALASGTSEDLFDVTSYQFGNVVVGVRTANLNFSSENVVANAQGFYVAATTNVLAAGETGLHLVNHTGAGADVSVVDLYRATGSDTVNDVYSFIGTLDMANTVTGAELTLAASDFIV